MTEPTGAPLKKTPLHAAHVALGARMVPFGGWDMPVEYAGITAEHMAVRTAAGLFDVSHMGELLVRGTGAQDFVQRLTPNDVSKLSPGRAHYSALLTERGTYLDDLLVYRLSDEEFLLVVNAANAEKDLVWLLEQRTARERSVVIEDVSDRYALLALQGPRAAEALNGLTGIDLGEIRYYRFAQGELLERPALISRTGSTGEDGFELYLDPEDAPALWRRLVERDEVTPAGLGARDTLRLEAGLALYGHELDEETTPWEAGLGWTVKLESGEFLGRDALLAQRERGVERRLIGFELSDRGIARQGHEVVREGEPVGTVTSGTWSPTFEKALGMAYVASEVAEGNGEVTIRVRRRELAARVVELPFYRRPRRMGE